MTKQSTPPKQTNKQTNKQKQKTSSAQKKISVGLSLDKVCVFYFFLFSEYVLHSQCMFTETVILNTTSKYYVPELSNQVRKVRKRLSDDTDLMLAF